MFSFEPLQAAKQAVALLRAGKSIQLDYDDPMCDMLRDCLVEGLPLWVSQAKGQLYLAHNDSWPSLYKIGCTRKSVAERMRALSGEGMLTAWHALHTWEVYDAHGLEALVHKACAPHRVKGELFSGHPRELLIIIDSIFTKDAATLNQGFMPILGEPFLSWSPACV